MADSESTNSQSSSCSLQNYCPSFFSTSATYVTDSVFSGMACVANTAIDVATTCTNKGKELFEGLSWYSQEAILIALSLGDVWTSAELLKDTANAYIQLIWNDALLEEDYKHEDEIKFYSSLFIYLVFFPAYLLLVYNKIRDMFGQSSKSWLTKEAKNSITNQDEETRYQWFVKQAKQGSLTVAIGMIAVISGMGTHLVIAKTGLINNVILTGAVSAIVGALNYVFRTLYFGFEHTHKNQSKWFDNWVAKGLIRIPVGLFAFSSAATYFPSSLAKSKNPIETAWLCVQGLLIMSGEYIRMWPGFGNEYGMLAKKDETVNGLERGVCCSTAIDKTYFMVVSVKVDNTALRVLAYIPLAISGFAFQRAACLPVPLERSDSLQADDGVALSPDDNDMDLVQRDEVGEELSPEEIESQRDGGICVRFYKQGGAFCTLFRCGASDNPNAIDNTSTQNDALIAAQLPQLPESS